MIQKSILELIEKPLSGEWGDEPSHDCRIKVLRNTNFTNNGMLDLDQVVERSINQKKIDKKILKCGDILIEKSGGSPNQPVGRVVYFDQKDDQYLFSNFTSMIRAKEIYSKYLFYLLFANHAFGKTIKYQNKTTGIINLQLERYLKDSYIPLPNYVDQQRIASILDHADSIRRKNKEILEKYNQLAQSVFMEMFGDPVRKIRNEKVNLGDVIKIKNGLVDPRISPYREMIHIGGDNIESGSGKLINLKKAGESNFISGKYLFSHDDLVYNKIRPYLNKVTYPGFEGICSADMYPIEPVRGIMNKYFLLYLLRSKSFLSFAASCSRRANIPKINREELSVFQFYLPPQELQDEFARILERIVNLNELTYKSINNSDNLFHSLLQRAFKGEL